MNDNEEWAWHEAGLQCDGVNLDAWEKDAVVRYGRLLHRRLQDEMHAIRLENSAQAAIIEKLIQNERKTN